jgi:hypothetical protein
VQPFNNFIFKTIPCLLCYHRENSKTVTALDRERDVVSILDVLCFKTLFAMYAAWRAVIYVYVSVRTGYGLGLGYSAVSLSLHRTA